MKIKKILFILIIPFILNAGTSKCDGLNSKKSPDQYTYYGCGLNEITKSFLMKYYNLEKKSTQEQMEIFSKHRKAYGNYLPPKIQTLGELKKWYETTSSKKEVKKSNNTNSSEKLSYSDYQEIYSSSNNTKNTPENKKAIAEKKAFEERQQKFEKEQLAKQQEKERQQKYDNEKKLSASNNYDYNKYSSSKNSKTSNNKNSNNSKKTSTKEKKNSYAYDENKIPNITKENFRRIVNNEKYYMENSYWFDGKDAMFKACLNEYKNEIELSNKELFCNCFTKNIFNSFSEKELHYLPVLFYSQEKNIESFISSKKATYKTSWNDRILQGNFMKFKTNTEKTCQ